MLLLGVNEGHTTYGRTLRDGAVCLLDRFGIAFALSEERTPRTKRAGGHQSALHRLETQLGLGRSDYHCIATSSCCEPRLSDPVRLNGPKIYSVGHHASHASAAYFLSPFEKALVVIVDAGGNVLDPMTGGARWWQYPREQHSYYLGEDNSLTFLDADCTDACAMGMGELYRAVTYFLGWQSSAYCGNTMALSAFGSLRPEWPNAFLVSENDGRIVSRLVNEPNHPVQAVESFFRKHGIRIEPRQDDAPISDVHRDLAYWVQNEVQKALYTRLTYLMKKHRVYDVCVAGGLMLNCSLLGRLWEQTPVNRVFVPIAPNDMGQSLGNALFVRHCILGVSERIKFDSASLGGDYDVSTDRLNRSCDQHPGLVVWTGSRVADAIADAVAQGKIVGLFNGRSEFGARALGFRSILGDPRTASMGARLNASIKKREQFMPYAPSILKSEVDAWFNVKCSSPHMQFAFPARKERCENIPAVVHVDGSSRLQEVTNENSSLLHSILMRFKELTGIPMMLNTSMNTRGEPIVETPEEALDLFVTTDIDAIAFGDKCIVSRAGTDLSTMLARCSPEFIGASQTSSVVLSSEMTLPDLCAITRFHFPDVGLYIRREFGLRAEYFDWLMAGKKLTTIRWRSGAADLPGEWILPLRITPSSGHIDPQRGLCRIRGLTLKRYCELDEADAHRDGFDDFEALRLALETIYGRIPRTGIVTIYEISMETLFSESAGNEARSRT